MPDVRPCERTCNDKNIIHTQRKTWLTYSKVVALLVLNTETLRSGTRSMIVVKAKYKF